MNDVRVEEDLDRWAEIIVGRAQRPIDAWAVAALLESEGLRDVDARDRFGKSDVFELAKVVHQRALAISPTKRTAEVAPAAGAARRIAANLLTGGLYALPLVGQIACIFTTRYSLWASLDYSPREATVVGVGTLASFIASGGLVTAIGREGSVHRSQRAFAMLRYGLTNLVALGLLCEILGIAAVFAFWLFAPVMDLPLFIPAVGYFAALSLLWTSMAALYALGSHVVSLASTVAGALAVAFAVRVIGLPVLPAQLAIILLTATFGLGYAMRHMHRLAATDPVGRAAVALPADTKVGMLMPYAAYGVGYFGLLFCDRALAWTAEGHLPQPIWFDAPYELAMDWALCSLLLPLAHVEHAIREFSRKVEDEQRRVSTRDIARHRLAMRAFCERAVMTATALSAISVAATYAAGRAIASNIEPVEALLGSAPVLRVFWQAAIGYQLLAAGLLGAVLLFVLNRPIEVVRAIWTGFATAALVGLVASRLLGTPWAATGLLAGAVVFASQTLLASRRAIDEIDFSYYAAF